MSGAYTSDKHVYRGSEVSNEDARITRVFATPLAKVMLKDTESLNRELAELFLRKEKEGDKYRTPVRIPTQIGDVFESTFDLYNWPDPPVQNLARQVHEILHDLVATLNAYTAEQMAKFQFHYHAWFHITRYGGYQSIHYHPKACWSGIYCVCAGEEVEGRLESGAGRRIPFRSHLAARSNSTILAARCSCTPIRATSISCPISALHQCT